MALLVFKTMVGLNKVPGGFDSHPSPPTRLSPGLTMRRVAQPPLNPALRDTEHHDFWAGFVAALIGVILVFCGARHMTAVDTVDGGNATEAQLIKAFTFDGLQYAEQDGASATAERR